MPTLAEAVSPSGAVARVRYDYAWKDVTYLTVVATVQDIDRRTKATRFDEPVGVAFASNEKAYVALYVGTVMSTWGTLIAHQRFDRDLPAMQDIIPGE